MYIYIYIYKYEPALGKMGAKTKESLLHLEKPRDILWWMCWHSCLCRVYWRGTFLKGYAWNSLFLSE